MSFIPKNMSGASSRRFSGVCLALLLGAGSIAANAAPVLTLNKSIYAPGEVISASFSGGPGNAKDWIGIYLATETSPDGDPVSLNWSYTHGTKTAVATNALTSGTVNLANTLSAGNYRAWFFSNDGYTSLVTPVAFSVGTVSPSSWVVGNIRLAEGVTSTAYNGKIGAYATASTGRVFSKVSGPNWLSVSSTGVVTGTPGVGDKGIQKFVVRVTSGTPVVVADASLAIEVFQDGQEHLGRFSVMTYNTWKEWTQVTNGYEKGLASIIKAEVDLVGLQESSTTKAQQLADDLGWHRAASGTGSSQIVSRYPIMETFTAGIAIGARVRISKNPVRDVIIFNCHLDYLYYGPYAAQVSGATPASVLQEENRSQRAAQMATILQNMQTRISQADQIPIFLTGDFNAPSHLDWTQSTSPNHGGVANVAWPASTAVAAAGLADSFRQAHPDPAALPGNSWSSIHKGTEAQDRIDFIYNKGSALHVVSSRMYATAVETTVGPWGGDVTPVANNTWPSDHFAFVTTFSLKPVDSDSNGLSDAWERRWFQSLGNSATGDPNSDGTSNAAAMLFGLAPVGVASHPLTVTRSATGIDLTLSISDLALGKGMVLKRSTDLNSWQNVWAFDTDPQFKDSAILGRDGGANGEWILRMNASQEAGSTFYRFHYIP